MEDDQSKVFSELSDQSEQTSNQQAGVDTPPQKPVEVGGPKGPEPTRYGDWEKAARCSEF